MSNRLLWLLATLVIGASISETGDMCGVNQEYAEKSFLVTADTGPKGGYVVSDRASADGKGGRALSVFLLKTDVYMVTVTFQPDTDGRSSVAV